ncbi:type II secretion system F family protein [Demetria terragena]|uniref:type II secretion system F family protein n=1 Tax=Demetria terragena TaxID=63959 RepID=UPI00037E025A|nr:hypothetical protein [Demetria terragena]
MLTLCAVLAAAAVVCWPLRRGRRDLALSLAVETDVGSHASAVAGGPVRWLRRRRRGVRESEPILLELLGGIAAGLEAGLPPPDAMAGSHRALEPRLRDVPELGTWLERLAHAAREGRSVGALWVKLGEDLHLPVAIQVGRAWSVSEQLGSPLTDAVRSTVAARETTARLDRAFAAQNAGPRATVQVLTLLPVLDLALMPVLGVDVAAAYPPAVLLLAVVPGLVLLALGRMLTTKMVDRALRTPRVT